MNDFASKLAQSGFHVYETSLENSADTDFAVVSRDNKKYLAVCGNLADLFCGKVENDI